MVGRDLLEAGVWSFMRILVLLHWTKVGNDKLTMEKLFVGTSLVRERIYDNLLATIGNLGGKNSPTYCTAKSQDFQKCADSHLLFKNEIIPYLWK